MPPCICALYRFFCLCLLTQLFPPPPDCSRISERAVSAGYHCPLSSSVRYPLRHTNYTAVYLQHLSFSLSDNFSDCKFTAEMKSVYVCIFMPRQQLVSLRTELEGACYLLERRGEQAYHSPRAQRLDKRRQSHQDPRRAG